MPQAALPALEILHEGLGSWGYPSFLFYPPIVLTMPWGALLAPKTLDPFFRGFCTCSPGLASGLLHMHSTRTAPLPLLPAHPSGPSPMPIGPCHITHHSISPHILQSTCTSVGPRPIRGHKRPTDGVSALFSPPWSVCKTAGSSHTPCLAHRTT